MNPVRASGHILSESEENYLKAIYHLQQVSADGRVSTTALAEHLAIAPASVTGMVQKLASETPALVDYVPRQGVAVNAVGEKVALEIIRHHRLIELYLHQALGYRWDEVHAEAERLEHVISEDFEDRVAELLGDPDYDPHGQPIPRKDGSVPELSGIPLTALEPGRPARVTRVSDDDADLLRYLSQLGLVPGVRLSVLERAPFGGPLHVQMGDEPAAHALGPRVTDRVWVEVLA